jgi:hypothetical protein
MPGHVRDLLTLRDQPYREQALLVGLSLGFLGLHRHPSISAAVPPRHLPTLDRIEREQREALVECVELLRGDDKWEEGKERGLALAQDIIDRTLVGSL